MLPNFSSDQQGCDERCIDVTVIIPTRDEGEWLHKTVSSIRLARRHVCQEIIIINDGRQNGDLDALNSLDGVRVVSTPPTRRGLIGAKNLGVELAVGKYVCFVDSHVVVTDYWLDMLRETHDLSVDPALVSGSLPDVDEIHRRHSVVSCAYTITNRALDTGWFPRGRQTAVFHEPLTPGGLMFTAKSYFVALGGFATILNVWGAEDVELSLRNYYRGGSNIVDPRVVVYHNYKIGNVNNWATSRRYRENSLYVAALYFPPQCYRVIRQWLELTSRGNSLVIEEIESSLHLKEREDQIKFHVRGFRDWSRQFPAELSNLLRHLN